jgi:quercetin dioxygenase-like cupin family protein
MSTPVIPIVEHEGEGHVLQFSPSEKLVWKATAETTGGIMDQFELTATPGHFGAPEHVHRAVDEFFYVLEGAFRFKVADTLVTAEAGSFLFVPRGIAHAWRNTAETTSRMILTYIPGGMEPFFEEASPYMLAEAPDLAGLAKVNEKYNTDVVGPPLPA